MLFLSGGEDMKKLPTVDWIKKQKKSNGYQSPMCTAYQRPLGNRKEE
jgi:hypothetical protein